VCVCGLSRYPACKGHVPCYRLWPVRLYNIFPRCLINATIVGGGGRKPLVNTKCAFWFSLQLLSETFLILRRTERDVIKNVYRSSCEVPFILVRSSLTLTPLMWRIWWANNVNKWQMGFNSAFKGLNLNLPDRFFFRNTLNYRIWMKIRLVGAELRADRRTDTTTLTAGFRNFANAPKTAKKKLYIILRLALCSN